MPDFSDDKRLNDILDKIGKVAALDFTDEIPTSSKNDVIDAIALGLNMLSEELRTNVVQRSKLDCVNQKLEKFAYTTAHDLKSPVNAAMGLIALMELTLYAGDQEDIRKYLQLMRKSMEQMKNLVQGILEYSTIEADEVSTETIDLQYFFTEITETDQALNGAVIQYTSKLPTVTFNRSALMQVVRNLLNNAVKYCDKEVCIISVDCHEKNDHYQISVSDNGPGIDHEYHEQIFQLFHRITPTSTKDSHGIGLATVKSILDAANERVWVESATGSGATFHFSIRK